MPELLNISVQTNITKLAVNIPSLKKLRFSAIILILSYLRTVLLSQLNNNYLNYIVFKEKQLNVKSFYMCRIILRRVKESLNVKGQGSAT